MDGILTLTILYMIPILVWSGIYILVHHLLHTRWKDKRKLQKTLLFLATNNICKGIITCTTLVLPVLLLYYLGTPGAFNIFNFLWIGFYSCLLAFLAIDTKVLKISVIILNFGCFLFLITIFLMGGPGIIPAVILKTLIPFFPTPWI